MLPTPAADDSVRTDPLRALRWLAAAGADEILSDAPVNRLAARPAAQTAPQTEARRPPPEAPPEPETAPVRAAARPIAAAPGGAPAAVPAAADAWRRAEQCQTLDALRTALLALDGFALKKTARNLVFADGNPASGIVFVGEAPGRDEDEQGLPFVGRSGKLLDRMLAAIGLDRTRCYITNVVVWRPPGNREPTPDEFAVLEPFFRRHLELLRPRVIVTLGGVPARHVLGKPEAVTRIRGRWHSATVAAHEVPVLPTLHPAFLLRSPAQKRLVWRDLLTLRERLDSQAPGADA